MTTIELAGRSAAELRALSARALALAADLEKTHRERKEPRPQVNATGGTEDGDAD